MQTFSAVTALVANTFLVGLIERFLSQTAVISSAVALLIAAMLLYTQVIHILFIYIYIYIYIYIHIVCIHNIYFVRVYVHVWDFGLCRSLLYTLRRTDCCHFASAVALLIGLFAHIEEYIALFSYIQVCIGLLCTHCIADRCHVTGAAALPTGLFSYIQV